MKVMKNIFAAFLLAMMWIAVLWMAVSVPVVEWSWLTGECVRVVPPEAGTCNELPGRYERVWVR